MFTDIKSAELIKYAANAFLCTKISFINDLAIFCEEAGANIKDVARGIGLDSRIGPRFLHAGIGYGGNCLKKDINALIKMGEDAGHEFTLLEAVESINEYQKNILFERLKKELGQLKNKKIAIWGLTFKPKTDDLRDAPSVDLINKLIEAEADVQAYDPVASCNNFRIHRSLKSGKSGYDAALGADAVMILTEWDEFRGVDFNKLKYLMRGNLILDGRNIYDPKVVTESGLKYIGIGNS
jgi:UDPglucose 6-dehydrogenase